MGCPMSLHVRSCLNLGVNHCVELGETYAEMASFYANHRPLFMLGSGHCSEHLSIGILRVRRSGQAAEEISKLFRVRPSHFYEGQSIHHGICNLEYLLKLRFVSVFWVLVGRYRGSRLTIPRPCTKMESRGSWYIT